jgi:anthranilate synthase/aminodeoxychorismate synthase-like glutamine amidotransferase
MVVLIDNYDSFTYNLVQALGEINPRLDIRVHRNDKITVDEIAELKPERVIISPGPCTPNEGGISNDVIRAFSGKLPLLGVCLGHQCIAYVNGGQVVRAKRLVHGKTSMIRHNDRGLFAGLSNPFQATRYHSLIVPLDGVPAPFVVTATCDEDPEEVMAMEHPDQPVFGVQFHPESFLTFEGNKLLANFLAIG